MVGAKPKTPAFLFSALAVLSLVFVIQAPSGSSRTSAQEPGAKKGIKATLKELLDERAAITRKLAEQTALRVKTGNGRVEELLEPTRLALEAALDASETPKERITVLEDFLATARDHERLASQFFKTGQGRESEALAAKAERLRIEIALARARAGKSEPKKNPGDVVPKKGAGTKVSTHVASIEAYELVRVFARVSGFLRTQSVDIGDRVKRGQVLAVLDVPELEKQLQIDNANVVQAEARVLQAKSRVHGAEAELDATKVAVTQAEAALKSAGSSVKFRALTYQRMKTLYDTKAIEERVLEESKERHGAALEAEVAAKAAFTAAKFQVAAMMTKIEQARADLLASEASVKVAQATRERSQLLVSWATIAAPFDGVITQRSYSPGELIQSSNKEPIVTVQRIDIVRVVAAIPENEAARVGPGNAIDVEIDALPGRKFAAKVTRTGVALDPESRTMRVEMDLPNPAGLLRPGMSVRVAITLDK